MGVYAGNIHVKSFRRFLGLIRKIFFLFFFLLGKMIYELSHGARRVEGNNIILQTILFAYRNCISERG